MWYSPAAKPDVIVEKTIESGVEGITAVTIARPIAYIAPTVTL
jgi:hypothetical protein